MSDDAVRLPTGTTRGPASLRSRLSSIGPTYGALAALVLLLVANMALTPNFASPQNLLNITLQVSTTVLVAIGMTLVMSTAGIDLSVGSVMALASVTATALLAKGVPVAMAAAMVVGLGVGLVNGTLISKFKILPIIVTLSTLIIGRGVAQVVVEGSATIAFTNPTFEWFGKGLIGPVPVQVLLMLVALGAAAFLVRSTAFGRYLVSVGGNEAAARLAGVRVQRVKISVYVICSLLAAVAGLIETARLGASDAGKIGQGIELHAIAAAVVGGTALTGGRASIGGTLIGALIMGVINTAFNMHLVPYAWSLMFSAAIILVAVYVQRPKVS
jgi:ribose/xylose/arabinose/galactoside ABC-type transport system permease subunit